MIRWPVAPLLQIVRAGRGVLNGAIDFCSGDGLLLQLRACQRAERNTCTVLVPIVLVLEPVCVASDRSCVFSWRRSCVFPFCPFGLLADAAHGGGCTDISGSADQRRWDQQRAVRLNEQRGPATHLSIFVFFRKHDKGEQLIDWSYRACTSHLRVLSSVFPVTVPRYLEIPIFLQSQQVWR